MSAAFIQNIEGPVDDLLTPLENTLADVSISFGVTMLPHLRDFSVVGPTQVTGVSETPSRAKIFTCRPTSAAEEESLRAVDRQAADTAQAYRGEPTAADLQDAMKFYGQGRDKGGFEGGVRMALQSILMSPRFLFRHRADARWSPARAYRVADTDMASRLSFFLWGTPPDAELLRAASRAACARTAGFDRQVRRMLADPRRQRARRALRGAVAAAAGPREDHPRLPARSRSTTRRSPTRWSRKPSSSSTASSARTGACSTC